MRRPVTGRPAALAWKSRTVLLTPAWGAICGSIGLDGRGLAAIFIRSAFTAAS